MQVSPSKMERISLLRARTKGKAQSSRRLGSRPELTLEVSASLSASTWQGQELNDISLLCPRPCDVSLEICEE